MQLNSPLRGIVEIEYDSSMKVSVITVAFNAAATIGKTLESVARQTHADIEHIVVDGASTDGTQAIANESCWRVSKFVSEPDRGIYDAMNKGLALAGGEVVGFLNADDRYADEGVLSRVTRMIEEEQLDGVFGDAAYFKPEDPTRTIRRYRSARFSARSIAWGWMPAHPALFLRRSVYERVGGFRTDYRIAGDYEFVARAFTRTDLKVRHIPEVLVRMQTGGVSTAGWRNTILLNREVLRACRDNGISTSTLRILSKYPFKILERLSH